MLKLTEDKMNRKIFIDSLFSFFEKFGNQGNRGLTMIINGKYGSGKTTLLGFIEEQNQQEKKFDIVNYNAWENNLFDNPLVPILYEISKLSVKNKRIGNSIKSGALKVIKALPKIFVGTLANAHNIDLTPLTEDDSNIFTEYDTYRNSIKELRNTLTEYCKDKKVLFFVDELDRCLPEYQIRVLEALYHLFEVPNLIVVITLDKTQLECAIKSKFGDEQNTLGYLSKFINYQLDLPDESKTQFIKSLMQFECDKGVSEQVKTLITKLLDIMQYSIRDCQRIVNEINIICKSVDENGTQRYYKYWWPILVAIILIIKHSNEAIYKKWFYSQKKDYYSNDKIKYIDSAVFEFFNDVKNTNIEPIFEYLKNPSSYDGVAQSFFVHFINAFIPIRVLENNDLHTELGIEESDVKNISYDGMHYPESINKAIENVKMIIVL